MTNPDSTTTWSNNLGRTEADRAWQQLRHHAAAALTPFSSAQSAQPNWGMVPLDVYENNEGYTVRCEVPGLDPASIDITAVENTLSIVGVKPTPTGLGMARLTESCAGRFERHISLPAPINEEKASAKYINGVLTVSLPKSATGFCRRIEVQGE